MISLRSMGEVLTCIRGLVHTAMNEANQEVEHCCLHKPRRAAQCATAIDNSTAGYMRQSCQS